MLKRNILFIIYLWQAHQPERSWWGFRIKATGERLLIRSVSCEELLLFVQPMSAFRPFRLGWQTTYGRALS